MKTSRKAFTVVELLISLAIMAMLMTAVALAFNASAMNYSENKQMYDSMNSARMALMRITTQLRTARSVQPFETADICSFQADDGSFQAFQFKNGQLVLKTNGSEYVLCDQVGSGSFARKTATVAGITFVKSMQVSMSIGSKAQKISTAVVLRKTI